MALVLILGFLPYFPYSKHAHLFMGPLNYMAKVDRRSLSTLEIMDLEDETSEQFGAGKLEHLPQKELLDGYACIMCNRCQDACPAYQTGKELSPSALEINKRYYLNENLKEFSEGADSLEGLSKWMLSEEAAWSCTTCGFCIEVCPVGNEPMVDILRMRQDLVLMESKFPREAMETFDKIENYGNPWGMAPDDREKWTEGMEVPKMREKGSAEYLYLEGSSPEEIVNEMIDTGVLEEFDGNKKSLFKDHLKQISSYIKKFPSHIEIEKMKQEDDWDTLDLGAIEELEKKDNELRSILVKRENIH